MSLILSIETSTPVCSIALHDEGKLIASQELLQEKSHSQSLAIMIRDILASAHIDKKDLKAIAVSEGPGSYTGLRIGTSTAKGLCFALSIPLIAINSLFAMASGVNKFNKTNSLLVPMLDARRMEVYCMQVSSASEIITETEAKIIDEGSYAKELEKGQIIFFGNGADKCSEVIRHQNAVFLNHIHTSAVHMGELAYEKFVINDFEDLAYFEPFYLKEFKAIKPKVIV